LNSIYINIICKNIRKLHCGDRWGVLKGKK
jgi:hypothetical protein